MADKDRYITPEYGIPGRFKTPAEEHKERMAALKRSAQPGSEAFNSWIPGGDFLNTFVLSTGSSFMSGFAGDAKTLDYVFDSDLTKDAEHSLRNIAEGIAQYKPTRAHSAAEKQFVRDDGTLGEAWGDIYAYADLAGSGLGSIGAMILGGGLLKLVGKGGLKMYVNKQIKKKADDIAAKEGISEEAALRKAQDQITDLAQKYDNAIGAGAYGTAEMAIVSGSVGQSIEQEVMRAPDEILNTSNRFREIYYDLVDNHDLSHDQAHNLARTKLSREAGIQGAKDVAIPTVLLGTVAGRYIDKAMTGRLTTSTLKNFAAIEAVEIPTESAQGAFEQYTQNRVYKELVDKSRNVMEGVPDAAFREGAGVAFGAAPLSMVSAKIEADIAQSGEAPTMDSVGGLEELRIIDEAVKVAGEARVEEVLKATADDPKARYDAFAEIIKRGNAPKSEEMDLDLVDDEALEEILGDSEKPVTKPSGDDVTTPPTGEVVADPESPGQGQPLDAPEGPKEVDTPTPEPEITGGPVEVPVEAPVEAPVEEEAPREAASIMPPAPPEPEVPAHKADFETFRKGKAEGAYQLPHPRSRAAQFSAEDIDNAPRDVLNRVGKAIGLKTAVSRTNLENALKSFDKFTDLDLSTANRVEVQLQMRRMDAILKEPVNVQGMDEKEARAAAQNLQAVLSDKVNEFIDREQHRAAIAGAVELGDFTLADFEALPENDQRAYAAIGRRLRAAAPAAEVPQPETPEGDGAVGEAPTEDTGGPAAEPRPEPEPEAGAGEREAPPPEGVGERGAEPEQPVEAEAEPTETDEEREAREAAEVAAREKILEELGGLEESNKLTVYGTTLQGKDMKPEVLEFVSEKDGVYNLKRGKVRRKLIQEDGTFYLASLTNKRSRIVTDLERKKQYVKDKDEERSGNILRRPHEIWKEGPKNLTDAEKALQDILKAVSHAGYINSVNYGGKTHGVKRYYTTLMTKVPTFLKFIAPHIGSEHGGTSPKEAVLAVLRSQPLVQYDENNSRNIQTPEELMALVDDYVNMLAGIQGIMEQATDVATARDLMAKHEFFDDTVLDNVMAMDDAAYEERWKEQARNWKDKGEDIKPNIDDGSFYKEYDEMYPIKDYRDYYDIYKEHLRLQNISDEKLQPKVPRERMALSDLAAARNGMPNHRQGKDVSRDDLMNTFGFLDVVYGDWVSDVALEGEKSERQQYRNLVYDAFADLAYLTGLPLKTMGRDLYLSLGALGHGKKTGAAFFSPNYPKVDVTDEETEDNIRDLRTILDNNGVDYTMEDSAKKLFEKVGKVIKASDARLERVRVIQFTREHGDGSFAHEWAHNLGNILKPVENSMAESLQTKVSIFGLHREVKRAIRQYIQDRDTYYDEEEKLDNLRRNLEATLSWSTDLEKPTSYMKNSKFMDRMTGGHNGKDYWSTKHEMFARATEAYIWDAILAEGDGASNPFLQGRTASEGFVSPENGYLAATYPAEDERQYFNGLLKQMFSDIEAQEDGSVAFPEGDESYGLKFGLQAQFERLKKDYLDNLDDMLQQASEDRMEFLLTDEYDEAPDIHEGMSDEELENQFDEIFSEEMPEERAPRPGRSSGKSERGPRAGTGSREGAGLGAAPKPAKSVNDAIRDIEDAFGGLTDEQKAIFDDLANGDETDDTRFSITIQAYGDTAFSVDTVGDRNPELKPETYEKILKFVAPLYDRFLKAGNKNPQDFIRLLKDKAPQLVQYKAYLIQFQKDLRDGKIDYADYVDTPDTGADQDREGTADGAGAEGADDGAGVQQPAGQQTGDDAGTGTATPETAGGPQAGAGREGATDLAAAGDNEYSELDPNELSERIQAETGLRSPSVEPLPASVGIAAAQVPKVPIASKREYENEYQVPTSMSENMQNAVLRLSDLVTRDGYEDLDDYVMKQLGYKDQAVFDNAFMSLQVEAIAAAIYQMQERHRSVIIADQTGVGKGRQAGALIRWAIEQGKVPVFVTESDALYTDMYYDMWDSGTTNVKPFITDVGKGIKDRSVDPDEAEELEFLGKKVPMLHKRPNAQTQEITKDMAKNGRLPADANAVFTTYAQMNTERGPRRNALRKLAENNDVILILDESHKAAKYDPSNKGINTNAFFTEMIKASWGTTYLSATFAKNPQNLAFYFNTDLADAMDGMKQLVDVLTNGGVQLQEVMSRALTRNGQLFRREIDYSGIDIETQFLDKNADRDKDFMDKLSDTIMALVPVNKSIVRNLTEEFGEDPLGIGQRLLARQEISQTQYNLLQEAVNNDTKLRITFTPILNQIHNLTDQIMVASKADLAVDAVIEAVEKGRKPIIGLDKTNMAMLNEYVTRNGLQAGDDMSNLNWASLLRFWGQKSFNVSINWDGLAEKDRIRGSMGSEAADPELVSQLEMVGQQGDQLLSQLDLPLSPIDYIRQTVEKRTNGKIRMGEITGRHTNSYGIDYYGDSKPKLFKVDKFQKREIIDRFNGEIKNAKGEKQPSDIDALIINQSGSTGVSLHSSEKHGDRKERHMTIVEPAGDINVFQQMLGRIFRTGMGDTKPYYTVLASSIPSDARKINVLRKKMESLNAQTSSNREGAAGVDVEDLINEYGDAAVEQWAENNAEFQEVFPNWENKKQEERGLAYWLTGKIALFPFAFQQQFYEEVTENFRAIVEQAKAEGTYTLEERFYDWKAKYLEEIVLAEPRKDGTGFNSGSYLVKFDAETDFRAMTPEAVEKAVEEGKAVDISPEEGKVQDILDFVSNVRTETIEKIDALKPDEESTEYSISARFDDLRRGWKALFEGAVKTLDPEFETDQRALTESRVEYWRENLERYREVVRNNMPKGTKGQFDELERTINRVVKNAVNKQKMDAMLEQYEVGKTYNITIAPGTDHQHQFQGTVIGFNRLNKTTDPYTLGDIEIKVAANKPGGTDSNGVITRTLGQAASWQSNPVREQNAYYDTPQSEIYQKYHDTLAETSNTVTEWVAIGNPLIAASELIPTGEYMQFSDSYGRRMFGIRMPKKAVEQGLEGMIKGNLEIPSVGGGKIITSYLSENPHSRLAREFGFRSRGQNVWIKNDMHEPSSLRVHFDIDTAAEKADDPVLKEMLDQAGVQMHTFEEDNAIEFSVPYSEAQPIVNQILRRSRLTVPGSMKSALRNYMNTETVTRAGDNVVTMVTPEEVKTYVYDYSGSRIKAHRGTYTTKKGVEYDGFYMEGLPRYFNLNNIARLTMMKGQPGTEHEGRPFLRMDEFTRGNVQNGYDGGTGLGKPILGESIKQDGTSFAMAPEQLPTGVTREQASATLSGLPFRLKRLTKVLQSESELPAKVRMKMRVRNIQGRVKGVFHEGRIYIVADNLGSPEQAMTTFLHEGVGHLGVRKLMGEELPALLDEVARSYPQEMERLAAQYNVDISKEKGRREIAEEVLAHAAEVGDKQSLINKIVAFFRKLVRALGFNLVLNDNDVRAILVAARKSIDTGGFDIGYYEASPKPMFSLRSKTAEAGDPLPEDTVSQAIKDGQPVDAIFRGLWGIAEATQVPKVVKATSAATLRGAMDFYDAHMKWAHPTMEVVAKGLIDQYGLDNEYRALKASMQSMEATIIDEVRDIIEVLESMGVDDKQAKLIQEILTNEAPREEAWDGITEPIRKRIETLGQQAVDLGLISQEAYDRNKGMYLHRVYSKYEMNRSGLERWADNLVGRRKRRISGQETMERGLSIFVPMDKVLEDTGLTKEELVVGTTIYKLDNMSANGQKVLKTTYSLKPGKIEGVRATEFHVRTAGFNRVKLHRDWTKQEREDMGEITDARYTLGKTFSLLAHDLSTGEFFQQIAMNEAWTMPKEDEKAMEGEIMSAEAATRAGIVTGAEWVRVPDTKVKKSQAKVYGALAGRVIRAEIYQDLNQVNKMQQSSIWKSIMTSFKLNKTARNPVVHFNNIMSNLVLMDMADVRFSDLYRAIVEIREKGKTYQEAKAHGAMGVSYAQKELQNDVLDKLLDEIHEATGTKPAGLEDIVMSMDKLPFYRQFAFMMKLADTLWQGVDIKGKKVGLRELDKKMLDYYQHEDEVFRLATYMRRRGQGMDAVEAGLSARDQFLNYDISAPWVNAARATVLPFISYTYRAVPIVAKSIVQRPWKMAKYFTIAYAMNAIGYALSGGDEDEERKSLRDEVSGKLWIGTERLIRMPWNDEEGNPYFWDVRRLIPVGDVFDMNQYHAALPIIPASMMPSGPIAMGFEFTLNKTGFFGQEIVDPLADDAVLGTQKTLDWLWKSYGPSAPWIPYSYYWDKLGIAINGGRDRLGREYEVIPALASSFGVKVAPHDVSYGMALKAMEIERTVEAVRHKLSFLEKDYWQGKVSKDKYEFKRRRYMLKLERLEKKARELFN